MTDTRLDRILCYGTNAERTAFTPDPPPGVLVMFYEEDTGDVYLWDTDAGPAAWIAFPGGGSGITELTGDVTAGPGSGSQAATIANDAVTFAKMQNITSDRLLGRDTAASGNVEELTVGGGVEFTGSTGIQRSALTGDMTATAGSNATVLATPLTPGGRLTLTSGTPVMNADATAQGTVYYAPYVHARLPLYTGSVWAMRAFSQLTLTLNATDNTTPNLYDIFVVDVGGTLTLGTGPAWTNSTTRADAIALLDGIWTNNASIALRANGSALAGSPFAANTATYLGTIYCTANGETGMAFKPSAASGGTANILGLYNAYNRVRINALCRDSNGGAEYTYNSTTWRQANNNAANRISWVDGLQQSAVEVVNQQVGYPSSATAVQGVIGTTLDSTTNAPTVSAQAGVSANITNLLVTTMVAPDEFLPQLGFHFAQRMEATTAALNYNFSCSAATPTRQNNSLRLSLEM